MRLIVFDLDHTLLTVNSSFYFGSFLYRQNFFSSWTFLNCLSYYARYKWLKMPIHALHAKTFIRLFQGRNLADIHHYVKLFLTESLHSLLYDPVFKRLKEAQERKDHVLILSSSPDFLVGEIARRLSVTHWNATTYQVNVEGKLIAISRVMEGEDKARYVKELSNQMSLSQSAITVYSDSYLDLPVLKIAGQAVGVVPDSHLKRICLQNGWEIL